LKDKVSTVTPKQELKENICRETENISTERLQRINQNLFHRCKE
jgi:hypothetical protein